MFSISIVTFDKTLVKIVLLINFNFQVLSILFSHCLRCIVREVFNYPVYGKEHLKKRGPLIMCWTFDVWDVIILTVDNTSEANTLGATNKVFHFWYTDPSKHEASTQCWLNIGPPSASLGQHKTSIGLTTHICWVRPTCSFQWLGSSTRE